MSALPRVLGRAEFRRLLVGQTVSALGDWTATIALMVYVLALTGSTTAVGGVLVLRLLPALIAGPIATRVARRWSRRTVMLAMDAGRAAVVVLLPLVAELWWVYLWAFVLEAAGLVFLPARDAAIPDLAGEEDLEVANGLMLGSSYGSIPVGAGLFALVSTVAGAAGAGDHLRFVVVFWLDALTFLVSYAAIRGLARRSVDRVDAERREQAPSRFVDALRLPLVAAVVPAAATVALGVGALFSVGVAFVEDVLGASPGEFGALVALFGVGAVAGLAGTRRLGPPRLARVRVGVLVIGVTVASISLAGDLWLAFAGAAVFGAAATATLVVGMSVIQERLAGVERELAFTAFHVTVRGGLALAALAAGGAADALGAVHWPVLGALAAGRGRGDRARGRRRPRGEGTGRAGRAGAPARMGPVLVSVLVVCDSTAALEPAWVETYGVQVVPLTVTVGSSTGPVAYADGDLSDAELERRAASGPVTTAAPAPGRWLDAVERYAGADGAVLIAVAERLSSSAQSARLAAHLGSRPDRPVQVVDSGSAAGGEALVVLAAARAAARGRDLAAVAAAASRAARGVHLVGTLGSLDRLAAGGRVPGLTLRAGRALDVHPLFRLRAGRVRPMVPAFSRAAAMDRITQACRASRPAGAQGTGAAVVSHALAEDDAQRLADRVRADGVPCEVGRFGSALLAHAGPGTVGLSWWWDTLEG